MRFSVFFFFFFFSSFPSLFALRKSYVLSIQAAAGVTKKGKKNQVDRFEFS